MFQKISMITITAAALCGGLGGFVLVNGPQETAVKAPKYGFVNIFDVQNACEKQKAIVAKIQKEYDGAVARLKERGEAMGKQMREELPLYEPGTAEYESLRTKLQVEKYQIELESKALQGKYRRQEYGMIEDFMTDLRKVVEDYSKQNGYDAIFLHRPVRRIRSQESLRAILNQWVLYRNESLDVTAEITKLMNEG